jgi:hypothetical protein
MENVEMRETFLNKQVKVEKNDHFCIFGRILEEREEGIILQTRSETSFISYKQIAEIRLDPRGE